MKRIAIISNIPITADNHKATLESLFKHVSIKVVTISEWHGGRIEADVALVPRWIWSLTRRNISIRNVPSSRASIPWKNSS